MLMLWEQLLVYCVTERCVVACGEELAAFFRSAFLVWEGNVTASNALTFSLKQSDLVTIILFLFSLPKSPCLLSGLFFVK